MPRVNGGGDDMIMPAVNNQVEPMHIMAMMARCMTLRLSCLAQMKQRWPMMMMMRWCQNRASLWGIPVLARPGLRKVKHVGTPPGSVVRWLRCDDIWIGVCIPACCTLDM